MVSLGKLSLNKYTVINISRSIKWFIRQSLLKKPLNSYNSQWDYNVLDFNYIPRAFLICVLHAWRTSGLHPFLGKLDIVTIWVKLEHSCSKRGHWSGVLRMKRLVAAFVLFEIFYFWLLSNVEGVCFQRNVVAKGRMLTVLCLKQKNHRLIWITFF